MQTAHGQGKTSVGGPPDLAVTQWPSGCDKLHTRSFNFETPKSNVGFNHLFNFNNFNNPVGFIHCCSTLACYRGSDNTAGYIFGQQAGTPEVLQHCSMHLMDDWHLQCYLNHCSCLAIQLSLPSCAPITLTTTKARRKSIHIYNLPELWLHYSWDLFSFLPWLLYPQSLWIRLLDNSRFSKIICDGRVPTQNSIYSGKIISYLIVICEVDHLIQTVMGLEYLTRHIESAFTPTKQLLKLCLADAGPLPGIKFHKHPLCLTRWTKDRSTALRDGVGIDIYQ